VIADLIALGTSSGRGTARAGRHAPALRAMSSLRTRYFVRLLTVDRPGVMAAVATVLGDRGISLASVVQKEIVELSDAGPAAEIVLTTHLANEAAVQDALATLGRMNVIKTIGALYRVHE
jgi:homoserine dehydrogenase